MMPSPEIKHSHSTTADPELPGANAHQERHPHFGHRPVLAEEVVQLVSSGARFLVDATVGGGGHAELLLSRFPQAHLFGCDQDPDAVVAARERLARFGERVMIKALNFSELHHYVLLGSVDFLLLDLGVSSHQLDEAARGFSFTRDGPLDMRMNPESDRPSAANLVQNAAEEELRDIIFRFGEERFAPRIAKAVVRARETEPIATTGQLARIVAEAVPHRFHRQGHHPATKTFQALRIAVNDELGELDAVLDRVDSLLAHGGRIAAIAFHSLEDRRVKKRFREWENPCACPPDFPRCVCGKLPLGRRVTRKPLSAGKGEIADNPRARSARLRAYEKRLHSEERPASP